jgi:hypothetical protein
MGGHGAIKLGFKHPEVFSVLYGMNPAMLGWGRDITLENPIWYYVLVSAKSLADLLKGGTYSIGILTVAQAFSPNPNNPPFYADFPFGVTEEGLSPAEPAYSKWEENFPVNMVEKYQDNISKLKGIRFDSAFVDEYTHIPPTCRALSEVLTKSGIEHIYEEYNGDHRNRLYGRMGRLYNEVLPYFWMLLASEE